MRIAFDCSHHLIAGGVRSYIQNLLHAVTVAAPEAEYLLHYRCPQDPTELPTLRDGASQKVVHTRVSRRLLSRLENSFAWPRIERWTGPIDVFHSPHFWLPVSRRARLVLSVHDVAYLKHPEYYSNSRLNDYGYGYLLSHSLRRADAVVVPCEHTRNDLRELLDVDDERIWVVPFGADPRFVPASESEQQRVQAELGVDRPYALYPVGTIDVRKNVGRTLRAFAQAFPRPSDRPLLLITGVGDPGDDIRQSLAELHLEGDVRIEDVASVEDLSVLMSGALWGLYPSLYEGFGLPALETLGCGMPLIASNVTSVPEVVGDAALLVDPRDLTQITEAMRNLHEDESLRNQLSQRGLARASGPAYSWERAARQTLAVYRDDRSLYAREAQPLAIPSELNRDPVSA